jgi:hypothetical protein
MSVKHLGLCPTGNRFRVILPEQEADRPTLGTAAKWEKLERLKAREYLENRPVLLKP